MGDFHFSVCWDAFLVGGPSPLVRVVCDDLGVGPRWSGVFVEPLFGVVNCGCFKVVRHFVLLVGSSVRVYVFAVRGGALVRRASFFCSDFAWGRGAA